MTIAGVTESSGILNLQNLFATSKNASGSNTTPSFTATEVSSKSETTGKPESTSSVSLADETSQALFAERAQEAANVVDAMDTDDDGMVTEEEFVSARPEGVSEDMAAQHWSNITGGAESVSTEVMQSAMAAAPPPPPPPPSSSGGVSSSDDDTDSVSTTYDALDTNEDGTVSIDEMLAGLTASSDEDSASTEGNGADVSSAQMLFLEAVSSYQTSSDMDVSHMADQIIQNLAA